MLRRNDVTWLKFRSVDQRIITNLKRNDERWRSGYFAAQVVERQFGGIWPASPSDLSETFPWGEIATKVMDPFFREIRSQASGGNCNARITKYRITFAWQTMISVESSFWEKWKREASTENPNLEDGDWGGRNFTIGSFLVAWARLYSSLCLCRSVGPKSLHFFHDFRA